MRAIIDADLILHRAAHAHTDVIEWEPGVVSRSEDLEAAKKMVDEILTESILDVLQPDTYMLAFSHPKNFRYSVMPEYKANRNKMKRPEILYSLKDWMLAAYPSLMVYLLEADDILGIEGTRHEDTIMCSFDKDLRTVPGLHFDWRKDDGVVQVSKKDAGMKFLTQCMTRDSTDGFYGIKGIGPKKAEKILADTKNLRDGLWKVAETYACFGYTHEYMLQQMRVARILRAEDWDFTHKRPILFDPEL